MGEVTVSGFLNALHNKANQANRPGVESKYQLAYNSIQTALKNPFMSEAKITQLIGDTFRQHKIEIKNKQIFGGKKTYKMHKKSHNKYKRNTKKNKHVGGFLYGNKKTTASTVSLTIPNKTPSTKTISTKTSSHTNSSSGTSKKSQRNTNKSKNRNRKTNTIRKR